MFGYFCGLFDCTIRINVNNCRKLFSGFSKEYVHDEIRKLKVNIHKNEVSRAHRFGEVYTDRNGDRQQAILAKFTSWDYFFQLGCPE